MAVSNRRVRQDSPSFTDLKGGPRGLLLYYILHSISVKPKHGYEILQDIESKTEGAWRPGVGSVYPILKKLREGGYIQAKEKGSAENRRVYGITEKGSELMKGRGEMLSSSSQRWMAMRRLFFDMLDPAGVRSMVIDGSRKQFEITRELLETRRGALSATEADFMLREYSINLERQLEWTRNQLREMRPRAVVPGKARLE